MIHAMTSSKQTHDISGSVEKPPTAKASLFELGKGKNVNETYKKNPRVCPLGTLGNNPRGESPTKFSVLLLLSRQMTHETLMFLSLILKCCSYWKRLGTEQYYYENCTVFSKDITRVFSLCLALK